jgi:hypothetical protein
MTSRNLTPDDRALADRIAAANPLERVRRTGHVKMLGADARLAANDEDEPALPPHDPVQEFRVRGVF